MDFFFYVILNFRAETDEKIGMGQSGHEALISAKVRYRQTDNRPKLHITFW